MMISNIVYVASIALSERIVDNLMFNFVFDRYEQCGPVANLTNGSASDTVYPYITPLRLLYYVRDHDYPTQIFHIDQELPQNCFYPIGLGFFDFSIDYFSLMSKQAFDLCKQGRLKILFYYHEGDNPHHQKQRLDSLCTLHDLPLDCYRFASGNTEANKIENFVYFPDHELFYWQMSVRKNQQYIAGCTVHVNRRDYDFTLLSRVHKWWRATIVNYLFQQNLLSRSLWSYNTISIGDQPEDNPLEVGSFQIQGLKNFLNNAPYTCDGLSSHDHNNHHIYVAEHYENSYMNLVLETLYDADQSGGAFITEKTFKPIRHGQPFVIFGTPGSVQLLKDLGYRTFDHVIDNSYDSELNNKQRFLKTVQTIKIIKKQGLDQIYQQCFDDVVYNQKYFEQSKYHRLHDLYKKLIVSI
jgi:hypothetical protein